MSTILNPYLGFRDTAREAITFYHSVLGGELTINTFGESGMSDDPAEQDKVMHASLICANGMTLMASDTPPGMGDPATQSNIAVSLSGDDEGELRNYWDGLSTEGTTTMPLEKAPWGDTFGMLTDKFGINWMVNIVSPRA